MPELVTPRLHCSPLQLADWLFGLLRRDYHQPGPSDE